MLEVHQKSEIILAFLSSKGSEPPQHPVFPNSDPTDLNRSCSEL